VYTAILRCNIWLQIFYNTSTGRWLSRDPLGERGGKNLYGFAWNDPLSYLDPLGLASCGLFVFRPATIDDRDGFEVEYLGKNCKCGGTLRLVQALKEDTVLFGGLLTLMRRAGSTY
jgi:hypothetical protein